MLTNRQKQLGLQWQQNLMWLAHQSCSPHHRITKLFSLLSLHSCLTCQGSLAPSGVPLLHCGSLMESSPFFYLSFLLLNSLLHSTCGTHVSIWHLSLKYRVSCNPGWSQTWYIAEGDLGLSTLLSLFSKCWHYRCVPPGLAHAVLRIKQGLMRAQQTFYQLSYFPNPRIDLFLFSVLSVG